MKVVIHKGEESWTIVTDNGEGLVRISKDIGGGVIIDDLSVIPESRGKGIGVWLIKEAERVIREEIKENEITVVVKSSLVGWFEKLGYSIIYQEGNHTEMMKIGGDNITE